MLCAQVDYQADEYGPYSKEDKGMGKFMVGDKIKLLRNDSFGAYRAGDVVEVTGLRGGCVYFKDNDGDERYAWDGMFEAVVVAGSNGNQPKFKVGDRVRVVSHCNWHGRPITMGVPIGEVRTITGLCKRLEEEGIETYSLSSDGRYFYTSRNLELAAPLTLREGGYYRTLDGRKVVPLVKIDDGDFVWESPDCYYDASGRASGLADTFDLVAEWTDEETHDDALPAALGLGIQPGSDKPKFKVGDRVTKHYWDSDFEIKRVDDTHVYLDDTYGGTAPYDIDDPDMRLVAEATSGKESIVCRIDSGQPLPTTRPYVHGDREAATAEASRLAALNPGKEFGVYELVAKKVADVTVRDAA